MKCPIMNDKIAILGAGAAGMVTAAWLLQNGHEVIVWDTEAQSKDDFAQVRTYGLTINGPGFSALDQVPVMTHDLAEAMEADHIVICVSSGRQEALAEAMTPFVREEQKILLVPGNLGSVVLCREWRDAGKRCAVLAELAECLWACRKTGEGRYVSAMSPGTKRIAALPSTDTDKALAAFGDLFSLVAGRHILENSLNSPNVISHVSGTLLNLGGIAEKGEAFALFEHGLSEGYVRCMTLLEEERDVVLKACGFECFAKPVAPLMALLEDIAHHPEMAAFRSLKGPDSVHHRFIEEDAACGVAMLYSLAQKYHIDIPVTTALLILAGKLTNEDYMRNGRTLTWIGKDISMIL